MHVCVNICESLCKKKKNKLNERNKTKVNAKKSKFLYFFHNLLFVYCDYFVRVTLNIHGTVGRGKTIFATIAQFTKFY